MVFLKVAYLVAMGHRNYSEGVGVYLSTAQDILFSLIWLPLHTPPATLFPRFLSLFKFLFSEGIAVCVFQ